MTITRCADGHARAIRYHELVMAAFVAILLLSNFLGAGKVAAARLPLVGDRPFGAGMLFLPRAASSATR